MTEGGQGEKSVENRRAGAGGGEDRSSLRANGSTRKEK